MPVEEFITWIYCWVDDQFTQHTKHKRIRQRGFMPALSDAEVITMEIVGEYLGFDTNKGIWSYFRQHWLSCFPALGSRSQFAKQATQLWAIKQCLQETLLAPSRGKPVHIVDGFPIPISHFKRARNCQRFKGEASYGYCASKEERYYGFKGHILIEENGSISGFTLTGAHESEREAVWELVAGIQGMLLGDKGYLGEEFKQELSRYGLHLETPVRYNMQDPMSPTLRTLLNRLRRRVETTIGQLVERFNIAKIRARNKLSLTNRLTRKLLAHGLCVLINKEFGREPLQLANIIQ